MPAHTPAPFGIARTSRVPRAALMLVLAALLAGGTVISAPTKAYAVVPVVHTPIHPMISPESHMAFFGTDIVVGSQRSTDSGASWLPGPNLVHRWNATVNGTLVGASTAGSTAFVYTVATGVQTSYSLPVGTFPVGMAASWALYGPGPYSAYNYLTGVDVAVASPTGATVASPTAKLTQSGGVLWSGTTADGVPVYAVMADPSSPAPAWVPVGTGTRGAVATPNQLVYVLWSPSSVQICSRPLSSLSSAPVCSTALSAASDNVFPVFANFGSSTMVALQPMVGSSIGKQVAFIWDGDSVVQIQVPEGSSIETPSAFGADLYGDTGPYAIVRNADTVPSLDKVNADGTLSPGFAFPLRTGMLFSLDVAADRVVGSDFRDGALQRPVWTMTVSASGFGIETPLPTRTTRGLAASAARTLVSTSSGLVAYDRGQAQSTIAGVDFSQLSGPYLTRQVVLATTGNYGIEVDDVMGKVVGTFAGIQGSLFGSEYVTWSSEPYPDVSSPLHVVVNDLTGRSSPRRLDLPGGTSSCTGGSVWGESLLMACPGRYSVFSLKTGTEVAGLADQNASSQGLSLGDGYALASINQNWGLWDLRTGTISALTSCRYRAVSDGVGHVACPGTDLTWMDYSSLSLSAGRVLGWLAPATFGSGMWTPQIDATKPFSAGLLRISRGSTVVRELTVPASSDGSVRGVSWDGKNGAGEVVPSGTYTATLVASAKDGSGALVGIDGTSAPTFDFVTGAPGSFSALTPSRLVDTRDGTGATVAGAVAGNGVIDVQVTGRGGVPASGVGAVILNVTAVTPAGSGFLSVYPSGDAMPNASNLNFTAGLVVPNLVLAKVGTGGKVSIKNSSPGATHMVVDVEGFFVDGTVSAAGGVTAVSPSRLLDTRDTTAVTSGGSVVIQATGRGGVPATGVSSVVVNLTAVTPTASGFLTAFPTGGAAPNASNVNFTAGQVVPNLAFVKLSADGSFTVKNTSPGVTHVVADVAGYVLAGDVTGSGMFVPLSPTRVLETRPDYGGSGAVGAGGVKVLTMTGAGGVPTSGVSGVVLNITVVASAAGFLTVYPADVSAPNASNVNFVAGQVVPNLVAVRTSSAGAVAIRNASPGLTYVIADVAGYFTG